MKTQDGGAADGPDQPPSLAADLHILYPSNFRDPASMLRRIADGIDAGAYGVIGSIGVVLLGDTCEVFGGGPLRWPKR